MIYTQQNLDLSLQIFHYAQTYHPNFTHTYQTFFSIIYKLCRARAFQPLETLLSNLKSSLIPSSENLFVLIIRNYGLANRPNDAFRMFLRIPGFKAKRTARSLNALLNALFQNGRSDLVNLIFNHSREKFAIVPDVATCNIAIKALCDAGDVHNGNKVLDEMYVKGLVPNYGSYANLLTGYVGIGDMENAVKVFDEMSDRGWSHSATTYTVLIDGFDRQNRFFDAVKIFGDMPKNGVEPDDVTYDVMINLYCKEGKSAEALDLLDDMLYKRFIPTSKICRNVVNALCEKGEVEEAVSLWRRLLKKNCIPDNSVSTTLIHWSCKKGAVWEAKKLFDEFEKWSIPSVSTYNALIEGMCGVNELTGVGKLWDSMVERGLQPSAFTYTMLIKGFCNAGSFEEGVRVLEEMLDRGFRPNKLTYSILFEGLHELKIGDVDKVIKKSALSVGIDTESWEFIVGKLVDKNVSVGEILDGILLEDAN